MKNNLSLLFKKKDMIKFRRLSGDNNPLHYDQRLDLYSPYAKPIVYAALIIEKVVSKISKEKIHEMRFSFKKAVFLDERIYLKFSHLSDKKITGEISSKYEKKIFFSIKLNNKRFLSKSQIKKEVKNISSDVGNFEGNLNVITNIDLSYNRSKKRNSSFKKLSCNLLAYHRQSLNISSNVIFVNFKKKIRQKLIYQKNKIKIPSVLKKKKILVIGENSGLGKILFNFFLENKINFSSTFFKKRNDPSNKNSFKLDINNLDKNILNKISNFDLIYYFPSTKIFNYQDKILDYDRFNKLNCINVKGMMQITEYLANKKKFFILFVPSTKQIEKYEDNLEYALSKKCQELLINTFKKKFDNIKFINNRFDAIYTESTKSLLISDKDYTNYLNSCLDINK